MPAYTVSLIPPEVLSPIFRILVEIDPPTGNPNRLDAFAQEIANTPSIRCQARRALEMIGWIRITHVCRSWREAAISDAALWTNIPGELPIPWVTEMLHRSKDMPVAVAFEGEGAVPSAFLDKVLAPENQPRLKALRLCPRGTFQKSILRRLDWPAPLLEELVLESISPASHDSLSNAIFSSTLPHLRRLSLGGWMPASWDAPYLCNLTSLRLQTDHWVSSADCLSIAEWLEILGRYPKLERVEVIGIIRGSSDDEVLSISRRDQVVSMPYLTRIVVEWQFRATDGIEALFDHLLLPHTCRVDLRFNRCFTTFSDVLAVLTLFSGNAYTYDPSALDAPAMSTDMHSVQKKMVLSARYGRDREIVCLTDEARFSVQWVELSITVDRLLQAVCETLHVAKVTYLKIVGDELRRLDGEILRRFFSSFPSVETLALSKAYAVNTVTILAEEAPNSMQAVDQRKGDTTAMQKSHALYLPSLETLVLDDEHGGDENGEMIREMIGRMLQARRLLGDEVTCVGYDL